MPYLYFQAAGGGAGTGCGVVVLALSFVACFPVSGKTKHIFV